LGLNEISPPLTPDELVGTGIEREILEAFLDLPATPTFSENR